LDGRGERKDLDGNLGWRSKWFAKGRRSEKEGFKSVDREQIHISIGRRGMN